MARNQKADSSWGHGNKDRIATATSLTLLAFMGADDHVVNTLYRAQLQKGYRYLEKVKADGDVLSSVLVFWALMEKEAGRRLREQLKARLPGLEELFWKNC